MRLIAIQSRPLADCTQTHTELIKQNHQGLEGARESRCVSRLERATSAYLSELFIQLRRFKSPLTFCCARTFFSPLFSYWYFYLYAQVLRIIADLIINYSISFPFFFFLIFIDFFSQL